MRGITADLGRVGRCVRFRGPQAPSLCRRQPEDRCGDGVPLLGVQRRGGDGRAEVAASQEDVYLTVLGLAAGMVTEEQLGVRFAENTTQK